MTQLTDEQLQKQVDAQLAQLDKLRNYDGDDKVISFPDLVTKLKDKIGYSFPCGIKDLDDLLRGFELGELVIISGPTKNGKTTFCQTITNGFSKQELKTLWFSFEMPMRQFLTGFRQIPEFAYAPQQLKNSTLLWIKSKILEAIIKYDIKTVFIDHLGFVQDLVRKEDRRGELDVIVRAIKTMAIELDIVIFAVHHVRKLEPGTIPTFDDLKESSSVAQDADKVLMLWREFERGRRGEQTMTGQTILSIELDRREGIYKKQIKLQYYNKEFTPCETRYDERTYSPHKN